MSAVWRHFKVSDEKSRADCRLYSATLSRLQRDMQTPWNNTYYMLQFLTSGRGLSFRLSTLGKKSVIHSSPFLQNQVIPFSLVHGPTGSEDGHSLELTAVQRTGQTTEGTSGVVGEGCLSIFQLSI